MEVILLHQRKSKQPLYQRNPGCSRDLSSNCSLGYVCTILMGTKGWQGQSDLHSSGRQTLKASCSALLLPSSGMHEKSSLTSWNNITLWRHCCFILYFHYPGTACRHSTNLITLNQFTFEESSGSMRSHKPLKKKRDTLKKRNEGSLLPTHRVADPELLKERRIQSQPVDPGVPSLIYICLFLWA